MKANLLLSQFLGREEINGIFMVKDHKISKAFKNEIVPGVTPLNNDAWKSTTLY